MKPRTEKKLSKRLVEVAPTLFSDAWVDKDVEHHPKHYALNSGEVLTAKQKRENYDMLSSVNNVWSVCEGTDYWGEAADSHTVWDYWVTVWPWIGGFPDHEFEYYPDTTGFRPTARNLLNLAAQVEQKLVAAGETTKVKHALANAGDDRPLISSVSSPE